MRACPHHGLEQWLIIHTFYNGVLYNTRMTIDAGWRSPNGQAFPGGIRAY